jgi:DNA helicase HerA-like ATPase
MVDRAMIRPPSARIGPVTPEERRAAMARSPVAGKYDVTVDPNSAYEILQKRVQDAAAASPAAEGAQAPAQAGAGGGILGGLGTLIGGVFGTNNPRGRRLAPGQVVARSVARSVGSEVARDLTKSLGGGATGRVAGQILRGTLGGVLRR